MSVNYLTQALSQLGISVQMWLNLDDDEIDAILAISMDSFMADLSRTIDALIS